MTRPCGRPAARAQSFPLHSPVDFSQCMVIGYLPRLWLSAQDSWVRSRHEHNHVLVGTMFVLDRHMGQSTKNADEELACLVLGTVLNTRVKRVDKSPLQGHHDLEIYYSDGRLGVGEVVSTRDPIWTELIDAVSSRGYAKRSELTRLWFVLVRPGTSLKRVQSHVPALLFQLESQGIGKVSHSGYGHIQTMLKKLGIDSCSSTRPTAKHPPCRKRSPLPRRSSSPARCWTTRAVSAIRCGTNTPGSIPPAGA